MLGKLSRLRFVALLNCWLILCLTVIFGCNSEIEMADINNLMDSEPQPDIVWDTGRISASLFYPGNEYTINKIASLLNRDEVDGFIAYFELSGYQFAPENSFSIKGYGDERQVDITFLVMISAIPSAVGTVIIACSRTGGELGIFPSVFTISQPAKNAGFQPVGDGLWVKALIRSDFQKSSARISIGQLRDYYNCLYSKLPGQVARCAVACVIASVAYVECISICTGAQMVGQAIDCLMQANLVGGKDKQQE